MDGAASSFSFSSSPSVDQQQHNGGQEAQGHVGDKRAADEALAVSDLGDNGSINSGLTSSRGSFSSSSNSGSGSDQQERPRGCWKRLFVQRRLHRHEPFVSHSWLCGVRRRGYDGPDRCRGRGFVCAEPGDDVAYNALRSVEGTHISCTLRQLA